MFDMQRKLTFLTIISSLLGVNVISINMFGFQLSLFRSLAIVITFFIIIEILLKKPEKIKNLNFSVQFYVVWLVYAICTLAWVRDYNGWFKSVFFLVIGVLTVIIAKKYLKDKNDILLAFKAMSVMIAFHNLIGWYEIFTKNYLFLHGEIVNIYSYYSRPVSMFGNINDFAVFLTFAVFIEYICAINSSKFIFKLFHLTILISSIVLLVYTGSRGALLGLICGLIIFVFFAIKRARTRKIVALLLLFLFLLVLFYPAILNVLSSSISKVLTFGFSKQYGTDFVRINLIKNGFLFLLMTFGFGTGAGNIEYWMANYGVFDTGGIVNIHNWWMEILVNYGALIFLLYIIFYSNLFISFKKRFKQSVDKIDITISLGIMSIMGGFIIASISGSSNFDSEWLWMFWAILISYQNIIETDINYNSTMK